MGIQYLDTRAVLEGHVSVEDTEALLAHLRATEQPAVDLAGCEHLHAAVLQVLLALRPALLAPPQDPWLAAALQALPHREAP